MLYMRIYIVYFIILYALILQINTSQRYYYWYPTLNTNLLGYGIAYPHNENEIPMVLNQYVYRRTRSDVDFFFLTDKSIIPAFQNIVPAVSKNKMEAILFSGKVFSVITFYKRIYNRARPFQVAPELLNYENGNLLKSQSAATPSYPSGHAFQSYYLARHLALHFPAKRIELIAIAKRISDIRIIGGLHFPSDRDFAWWLVDKMF